MRSGRVAGLFAMLSLGIVQCAAPPVDVSAPISATPTTTTVNTPRTTPTTTVDPTPAPAVVRPVTAADLGPTWRPDCPVPPERLRAVDLNHVGFDGRVRRGTLVVHEELAAEIVEIFDRLLGLRFPIEKMQTVDRYQGASDDLSMADNNTSAFNCRPLPGSSRWSWHAFGRAIDINPRLNPFLDRRGLIQPADAGPFLDRTRTDPGLIRADDPVVRVFTDRGWRWGGFWRTPIDYQHFEHR